MDWKQYRMLADADKRNEAYYIIGLDIGNDSSSIAFYNLNGDVSEVIDLSGGYGKPSIPTVVQYIQETGEWVFGEYAILNRGIGTEITMTSLVAALGSFGKMTIAGKSMTNAQVLGLFIKELLGCVKNINPRAVIVGIVASVPAYFSESAAQELTDAFIHSGYEKELIALISDRECVLTHFYASGDAHDDGTLNLLLDFGSQALRGGIYQTKKDADELTVKCISSLSDETIGEGFIMKDVRTLIESFVDMKRMQSKEVAQLHEQVSAFAYQHKDMLFQKNIRTKPVKLYYNFVFPPAAHTVAHEKIEALVQPYVLGFKNFLIKLFENAQAETMQKSDIINVLTVGGGFEMLWARDVVQDEFSDKQVVRYKNPKLEAAKGAAIIAAQMLGLKTAAPKIQLIDLNQIQDDIGIFDDGGFITLIDRKSFWWDEVKPKLVLVTEDVNDTLEMTLGMLTHAAQKTRGAVNPDAKPDDVSSPKHVLTLKGLPIRPKRTTRLQIAPKFTSATELDIQVKDLGFGDIFPKTEYEQSFKVKL